MYYQKYINRGYWGDRLYLPARPLHRRYHILWIAILTHWQRKSLPYIKDTNNFLLKLQQLDDLLSESLLVTLDVISLYTNIPHQKGLDAGREILNKREVLDPPTEEIVHLTSIILKRNHFSFDGLQYLQKQGTAMWTHITPPYANIFMGRFDRDLLQQTTQKLTTWLRYIDDIFAVWPHGEENLQVFLTQKKLFHATIKFTAEWSRESVMFLDPRVICDGNRLVIDLYTKPTNTHQYLHQCSCHPSHCKSSIAYSQVLRIQRIFSRPTDYQQHMAEH